jgi:hypothetical protein
MTTGVMTMDGGRHKAIKVLGTGALAAALLLVGRAAPDKWAIEFAQRFAALRSA